MTATDEKAATLADLAAAIGDEDAAVADVLALVPEAALAKAWAAGHAEFGRRRHCVTGRPGVPESKPALLIEANTDWTGEKTAKHTRLAALLAEAAKLPDCRTYKKYVLEVQVNQAKDLWDVLEGDAKGRDTRWTTAEIDRAEAAELLALRVRLTDKGLAAV
jgi:hypothetical protein